MTRLLVIIPASLVDAVRATAAGVFGDVALTEFVPAGSPTGDAPATHWWLAGVFSDEDVQKVQGLAAGFPAAHVENYDGVSDPARPAALLGEMGLKRLTTVAGGGL